MEVEREEIVRGDGVEEELSRGEGSGAIVVEEVEEEDSKW